MQRLFFAFPAGLPGSGLLLLRLAISVTGLYESHFLLTIFAVPFCWLVVLKILLCIAIFSVLIGLTTPIASFSLGLGASIALILTCSPWSRLTQNDVILLNLAIMALVNATVGPGAYSVDARLFGRREVIFPE